MLGRNEELREHIVKFEDEDGDITERQGSEGERPRRTWAESVATPVEHQGRKTWVTSLIESPITPVIDAPITPVVDDHLNSVPTSPSSTGVEEHQLQCELGPVASTCASAALCSERNTGEELSQDLMARLSPTVEQLPPVAQDVSCGGMASRQEGGIEPRLTMSVEPGQEAHATLARAHEQPSIAQDIIYGHKLVSQEQLERIQSQERATHTTPREDSSRGKASPSTAQDIIYARGTTAELIQDAMSPRLISTRGHAPPSTAQDIMYARGEDNLVKQSTRGQVPPSVVQDIMYAHSFTQARFSSTRGKPPPTSIQRLLYPVRDTEEEEVGRSAKVPRQVKEEEQQTFATFQPYQDSYPMFSELPIQWTCLSTECNLEKPLLLLIIDVFLHQASLPPTTFLMVCWALPPVPHIP